jgi:hypothetical protein
MRTMWTFLTAGSVASVSALGVMAVPAGATAAPDTLTTGGVPQANCFWFGPMDKRNPVTNKAYPETAAIYWGARFRVPSGARLILDGRYPHARFMSVNAYVDQGAVDSLEDADITPKRHSINPYVVGADRYAGPRRYRVTVPAPGEEASGPNVLDAPDANPGAVQELIYRVYLPDRPADAATRALPRPRLRLADGSVLRGRDVCRAINDQQRYFTVSTMPAAVYESLVNTPGADPVTNSAFDPVRWERFFNTPLALSIFRYDTPSQDLRKKDLALGEVGGFYDNRAVKYTVGPINAAFGDVLVLRGKLPRTPRTGRGVERMGGGQMRYWSICQNTSPVETQGVDCVDDSRVRRLLRGDRRYTIVVSRRATRPDNARRQCGVAWLNWGNRRDVLGRRSGTLIMRNLGANPRFAHSLQKVTPADISVTSNGTRSERDILGPYLPRGHYTSTADFEGRGCSAPGLG